MSALFEPISQWWRSRFDAWLNKRVPLAVEHLLYRKNLYTFPTPAGFAFFGIIVLLWLLGTNYQNNLILALSYMLISLSIIAILVTYSNLAGLKIRFVGDKPGFVGDAIGFILEVDTRNTKNGNNIEFRWRGSEGAFYNFDSGSNDQIIIHKQSTIRGPFFPGKLLVESTFPLGLIRCWSWLNLDASGLVFPRPIHIERPISSDDDGENEGSHQSKEGDDFSGLREYFPGAPIKHVAWKHYAREKGLYCKEFAQEYSNDTWLEWEGFQGVEPELRLSGLCYWAIQLHGENVEFGLRIPGCTIEPGTGEDHYLSVLTALACFDKTGSKMASV